MDLTAFNEIYIYMRLYTLNHFLENRTNNITFVFENGGVQGIDFAVSMPILSYSISDINALIYKKSP
jgi:hypothetical protein